jgi:hypothetical protein
MGAECATENEMPCSVDIVIRVDDNKKTGRKINSPPGLTLGVVIPKEFGVVIERWA